MKVSRLVIQVKYLEFFFKLVFKSDMFYNNYMNPIYRE